MSELSRNKREKLARFGIATKGLVYVLIGTLTAMAAFGGGGKKTGSRGVLDWLSQQSFGQVLLVITSIGLLAYTGYRLYQAIKDPNHQDSNSGKRILKRIGLALSGLLYGAVAFSSLKAVFSSSGGSGQSREGIVAKLLSEPMGQVLVGLIAAIFIGKAVYQIYKAYSGKFKNKIKEAQLPQKARDILMKTGRIGYTARGIVIGIVGFLTAKAALTYDASKAGGTEDAFQFIQNEWGTVVMGIITLGLLAYGVFQFVKAKYAQIAI